MEKDTKYLKKVLNELEQKINERGYKKVESMIKTYQIGNEIIVRLDDVLELARVMKEKYEEGTEPGYICKTDEEKIYSYLALNHLQVQLLSNQLNKAESIEEHKQIITEHAGKNKKKLVVPSRYAVGRLYDKEKGYWMFFVSSENEKPVFTNRPCMAKKYQSYKQAEACRDFLDDGDWDVVDMWESLSNDEKLIRGIFGETDWDDGNEKAIKLNFG